MKSELETSQLALIRGFNTESFEAFVWDYYLTLGDLSGDTDTESIYALIFGCQEKYQAFLLYCKDNNYCFLEGRENGNICKVICLLAFEQIYIQISDGIKNNVGDILDFCSGHINLIFANARIPNTSRSYMSGLLQSVYNDVSLNTKGEVIYYMRDVYGGYQVYSFESGTHYVDETGTVMDLIENNTIDRIEHLNEIKENNRDIDLVQQTDFSNDEGLRLRELRGGFTSETGMQFTGKKEEELVFRSWVFNRHQKSLKEFRAIGDRDIRKPTLKVVD